jgi:cytochrome P450
MMRTDVNILDAPVQEDRTPGIEFLRDKGPVFQDATGNYWVTSAKGVQYVLQHPKIFSSQKAFVDMHALAFDLVPLGVDPPAHVKFRRVLDPLFSPRQISPMEEELRAQAATLIARFIDRGFCDAVPELTELYPTQVFLTIFGLPLSDRDMCAGWVRTINDNSKPGLGDDVANEALRAASASLTQYLQRAIADRQADPDDGILSQIIHLKGEDAWTEDEILGFAWLFTLAGLDTVTATMGFVIHYLATHPEARQQLIDDPELIGPTIEELMRLETVVQFVMRVANEDVVVEGYHIPANSVLIPYLPAANRDPERYDSPNDFDLANADTGHFGFGGGIHRCVGSHLARRELRIMVDELLKQLPNFRLAEGAECTTHWPCGIAAFVSVPLVWDV